MLYNFQILTDALSDLPDIWLAEHPEITIVDTPITVSKGDDSVVMHWLKPGDFPQVAAYVDKGYSAHTSCPNIYMGDDDESYCVESITRRYLDEGKDVLYMAMSGTLSSTSDHVSSLYKELSREYPDRKVICIDTHCMSTGLGLLVMDVCDYIVKEKVTDIKNLVSFIEENRGGIAHIFSWSEFSFIRKSGRVGLLPAFLGGALKFQPFCSNEYDDRKEGERLLIPIKSTVRGREKFAKLVAAFAKETITDPTGTIIVAHGDVQDFAYTIADRIKKALPEANILVGPDWHVSAGIQVHGGPTSVHINFHRKQPNCYTDTCEIVKRL
ncbi:MAG: DegV family EDD domain-containing protein [Eubacterium sp.]|nr:DegV family EDD domain-containing protein [Eubacterium sp.]